MGLLPTEVLELGLLCSVDWQNVGIFALGSLPLEHEDWLVAL